MNMVKRWVYHSRSVFETEGLLSVPKEGSYEKTFCTEHYGVFQPWEHFSNKEDALISAYRVLLERNKDIQYELQKLREEEARLFIESGAFVRQHPEAEALHKQREIEEIPF